MTQTHWKLQKHIQSLRLNMWDVITFEKKLCFPGYYVSVGKFMLSTVQLVSTAPFLQCGLLVQGIYGSLISDLICRNITWTTVQPMSLMWLTVQSLQCREMLQNYLGSKAKNILSSWISRNYLHHQCVFAWAPVHSGYPCLTSRYQDFVSTSVSKDKFFTNTVLQVK